MTKYVRRIAGRIVAAHDIPQPGEAEEGLDDNAAELLAFFAAAYPPPTYRQQRAVAYIARLGKDGTPAAPGSYPSFQDTVGDVVDALQKQVRLLTASLKKLDPGFADDPDFIAITAAIDTIKAQFPKPAT